MYTPLSDAKRTAVAVKNDAFCLIISTKSRSAVR